MPCPLGQSEDIAPGGETLHLVLPSAASHNKALWSLLSVLRGRSCPLPGRGLVPGLSGAFALSPEFIVIHNGIITNYKDLRKFLVSDVCVTLTPALPLTSALTHFPAHFPTRIPPLTPRLSHPLPHSHSLSSICVPPLIFPLTLSHSQSSTYTLALALLLCEYVLPHPLPTSLTLPHSQSPRSPSYSFTFALTPYSRTPSYTLPRFLTPLLTLTPLFTLPYS